MDKSGTNQAAMDGINKDRDLPIEVRQIKYLNNIVEQDHRFVKRVTKPMLGFKSFIGSVNATEPLKRHSKKHATADGAAYFREFGQRHGGVSRIDVYHYITKVFMGLQVLRCDVDTVIGKILLISERTPGTLRWMCSRRCLPG